MAITNQERVGKAMELLRSGLAPFVAREFKSLHNEQADEAARRYFGDDRTVGKKSVAELDVAALLRLMWEAWNDVFGGTLGRAERSLVSELRDCRNKWAHQEPFSSDDADRALDSMSRLLTAVSATEADDIGKMKMELRRLIYDEQVRGEKRKSTSSVIEVSTTTSTLKPWREIVTPHADVASGRYQQAEFAADLWQVHLGEGSDEYRKPPEFFRRTYLTESLKRLLVAGVQRISGKGGDPVVQLQTNFGGGNTPRLYRNTLAFLAADKVRLQDLDEAVRKFLAWKSILTEQVALNLDPHQVRQAENQKKAAESVVTARIPETYQWILVPEQVNPQAPITWQANRLSGSDALAVRASKRLRSDELLVSVLGSTILRKHIDDVPLWQGDHVAIKQLVEHFARYHYLPRLGGPEVLAHSICEGIGLLTWQFDTFAYAESYDEVAKRYRGLRSGQLIQITADNSGLLVKPDVAKRQMDSEVPLSPCVPNANGDSVVTIDVPGGGSIGGAVSESRGGVVSRSVSPAPKLRRFHGTVNLDPTRVGRDASRIADEVIAHLAGQVGADVTVTLEIAVSLPDGASEQIVRIVTENSRTLKFTSHGFENDADLFNLRSQN